MTSQKLQQTHTQGMGRLQGRIRVCVERNKRGLPETSVYKHLLCTFSAPQTRCAKNREKKKVVRNPSVLADCLQSEAGAVAFKKFKETYKEWIYSRDGVVFSCVALPSPRYSC